MSPAHGASSIGLAYLSNSTPERRRTLELAFELPAIAKQPGLEASHVARCRRVTRLETFGLLCPVIEDRRELVARGAQLIDGEHALLVGASFLRSRLLLLALG